MGGNARQFYLAMSLSLFFAGNALAADYAYVDLAPGDLTSSRAYSVNDNGQTVGISGYRQYYDTSVATLWSDGGTTYLDRVGSFARDINNAGQITGDFYSSEANSVIWDHGARTYLTPFGEAHAINDAGQVVGSAGPLVHATTWIAGQPTDLGGLSEAHASYSFDINNQGQIVGGSIMDSSNTQHATFWDNGHIVDLGKGLGVGSRAWAINDAGQIVGSGGFNGSNIGRAVLWASAYATPVALPSLGSYSAALDINESGDIVGYAYRAGENVGNAVLWRNGVLIDLNRFLDQSTLNDGWHLTEASAINNNGWIVGQATQSGTNLTHAFLLVSTIPEPGTLKLSLLGLGLLLCAASRGRVHA